MANAGAWSTVQARFGVAVTDAAALDLVGLGFTQAEVDKSSRLHLSINGTGVVNLSWMKSVPPTVDSGIQVDSASDLMPYVLTGRNAVREFQIIATTGSVDVSIILEG